MHPLANRHPYYHPPVHNWDPYFPTQFVLDGASLPPSSGLRRMHLGHGIESATILEPPNLSLVESVRQGTIPRFTILGMNLHCYWLTNREFRDQQVNFVVRIDLVVVGWVGES